jgi:hypothetical protein
MALERTAQLRAMEVEVEKLQAASTRGDMAGIARGHGTLRDQLITYLKGLEADKDGERVSSDPIGKWYKAALELTRGMMEKVGPYMRTAADEKEEALAP